MLKQYYELILKPQKEYVSILNLLNSLSDEAIEEDNGTLILRSAEDLSDIKDGIELFAKAIGDDIILKLEKKANEDWIKKYQQSVKSIQIGNFFIRPSWEEKREDKLDVIVDPALSFGSGHHETTSSCIEAIDTYVKEKSTLLDVGCGSGILSICAAKKGAIVDICDTDEICIKDTSANFLLNKVEYNNSWIGSVNKAVKKYDFVVANIVADVLSIIANDLKKSLKDDGVLIISGILNKHKNRVYKRFENLKELKVIQKGEWVTMIFKK